MLFRAKGIVGKRESGIVELFINVNNIGLEIPRICYIKKEGEIYESKEIQNYNENNSNGAFIMYSWE